jgi:hypothetical protein
MPTRTPGTTRPSKPTGATTPAKAAQPARSGDSGGDDAATAAEVETFIDRFEPAIARRIRDCRDELRRQLPGATELVYDNYNFLVIAFAATPKTSHAFVSIASDRNGVTLMFYWGAKLADPNGLLQGDGKQNRYIRLPDVEALGQPDVRALIQATTRLGTPALVAGGGRTFIRSRVAKQRPRRNATPG